jgi:two-component system, NtrC family, sensor histidine kinase HydH
MNFDEAPTDSLIASFRQQSNIFSVLNLFVIAALFLAHVILAPYWGRLTPALLVALGLGFLFHAGVLIWVQAGLKHLTARTVTLVTTASISINTLLTFVAAASNHEDSQYFALMIVPILEAAFRFSLAGTLLVIAIADFLNFFWVWEYYVLHPSKDVNEYLEAGTVSLIYTLVGIIVWVLVNRLRRQEAHLARNLAELERTRQQLVQEEKLAAIGRLSSAIAHEIRNPVAMISSSLNMASREELDVQQRREMFDIAAKEAFRLERLTGEFLVYARPLPLATSVSPLSDTLHYVASACQAYASEKRVHLVVEIATEVNVSMDSAKIQQALLNLVKNAIEASSPDQSVTLTGTQNSGGRIRLQVQNAGAVIPDEALKNIFEPFFTTKPGGTGLGLAITRNIARAHGGDLALTRNEMGNVCFAIELPGQKALPVH